MTQSKKKIERETYMNINICSSRCGHVQLNLCPFHIVCHITDYKLRASVVGGAW